MSRALPHWYLSMPLDEMAPGHVCLTHTSAAHPSRGSPDNALYVCELQLLSPLDTLGLPVASLGTLNGRSPSSILAWFAALVSFQI